MPELPEVETVRRGLSPAVGKRVRSIWYSGAALHVGRPVDLPGLRAASEGAVLHGARRWGKFLLLDFRPPRSRTPKSVVVVHLGMTGRLRIVQAKEPQVAHTHVVWRLGRTELRFSDPRRFGFVTVATFGAEREHPSLAKLGPDPLDQGITGEALHAMTRKSRQPIKVLLLDQRRIAGIGNIYASEALWMAKIRPTLPAARVTRAQAELLAEAIPEVLHHALSRGGTSLRDFVAADGTPGEFREYLMVYDRTGESCARTACPGVIKRTVTQGRATFLCPRCQH